MERPNYCQIIVFLFQNLYLDHIGGSCACFCLLKSYHYYLYDFRGARQFGLGPKGYQLINHIFLPQSLIFASTRANHFVILFIFSKEKLTRLEVLLKERSKENLILIFSFYFQTPIMVSLRVTQFLLFYKFWSF